MSLDARIILKVVLMGLIFRGFHYGKSKTTAKSKDSALELADKALSELKSNMAPNFNDPWLASVCTPVLSIPLDIEDWLGLT